MPPNKRLPRIERDEVTLVHEDENQHLWAVSYSDFLMALLSFFILFFSVETPQRQQLIMELAGQFSGSGASHQADGDQATASPDKRLPANVFESLQGLDVTVDKEKEVLIVNFPDDFYKPGQHHINQDKQIVIQKFLEVIKPYITKVNLYFEGHADDSPLKIHKNDIIVDNFVLSSLRASTALGLARHQGFSEKHMFIQAASSNLRNSRSLSIRIEPRGEIL